MTSDVVDTSCIIEEDDGTIQIDAKMPDSEGMVRVLKETLLEDGFMEENVEVKYEGRRKKKSLGGTLEKVTQMLRGP